MAVRHTGSNLRRSRDLDSLDEPFDLVVVQWNIILVEPAHTRRPEVYSSPSRKARRWNAWRTPSH